MEDAAAFGRGLDYLYELRILLPEPDLIDLMLRPQRHLACIWIGQQLDALNGRLAELLWRCQQVLPQVQHPSVRLCAAPLAAEFNLDGLCCWPLQLAPQAEALILLDLGVLESSHWPSLLAHEYAHALAARPGHGTEFQDWLTQLCSALHLPLNRSTHGWNALPDYPRRSDRMAFWLGDTAAN